LQAGQARGGEAFPPQADGVAVAVEFGRDLLVGGLVGVGGPQDEPATKDQSLRRGACADQRLELLTECVGQMQRRAKGTRHERPPCGENNSVGV
jgi:hypothetical protein